MAKKAKLLFDSIGWKPQYALDSTDRDLRRETMYCTRQEAEDQGGVELPDSEFDRLEKLGAVAKWGSDAEPAAGPTAGVDVGPPLPGQSHDEVAALATEPRPVTTAVTAPEAYPTVEARGAETAAQKKAREKSDKAGADPAKTEDADSLQTDTAEAARQTSK